MADTEPLDYTLYTEDGIAYRGGSPRSVLDRMMSDGVIPEGFTYTDGKILPPGYKYQDGKILVPTTCPDVYMIANMPPLEPERLEGLNPMYRRTAPYEGPLPPECEEPAGPPVTYIIEDPTPSMRDSRPLVQCKAPQAPLPEHCVQLGPIEVPDIKQPALRESFKPKGWAPPVCPEPELVRAPVVYTLEDTTPMLRPSRPVPVFKEPEAHLPEHCIALGPIEVPDTKQPALRERFKPEGYVMAEPECVEEERGPAPEYVLDTSGAPLRSTRPAVIKKPEVVPLPEHCVALGPIDVPDTKKPALRERFKPEGYVMAEPECVEEERGPAPEYVLDTSGAPLRSTRPAVIKKPEVVPLPEHCVALGPIEVPDTKKPALRERFKPEGYVMAEPECVEEERGPAPEYVLDTSGAPLRSTRPAVIKKPEVVPLPEHCVALGPIEVPDTKKPALRERFKPEGYMMAEPECVEEERGPAPEYVLDTSGAPLRSTRPAVIKKPEVVPLPEHCVALGPIEVPDTKKPALRERFKPEGYVMAEPECVEEERGPAPEYVLDTSGAPLRSTRPAVIKKPEVVPLPEHCVALGPIEVPDTKKPALRERFKPEGYMMAEPECVEEERGPAPEYVLDTSGAPLRSTRPAVIKKPEVVPLPEHCVALGPIEVPDTKKPALRERFKPEGYVMAEPECVEEERGPAPEYVLDTSGAPLRSTRPAVIKKPEVVPLPEHCVALGPIEVPDTKKPALRERFKPEGYVMAEPECVEEERGPAPEYVLDTSGAPLRSTRPAVIKKPEVVPLPEHCVALGPIEVPDTKKPALRERFKPDGYVMAEPECVEEARGAAPEYLVDTGGAPLRSTRPAVIKKPEVVPLPEHCVALGPIDVPDTKKPALRERFKPDGYVMAEPECVEEARGAAPEYLVDTGGAPLRSTRPAVIKKPEVVPLPEHCVALGPIDVPDTKKPALRERFKPDGYVMAEPECVEEERGPAPEYLVDTGGAPLRSTRPAVIKKPEVVPLPEHCVALGPIDVPDTKKPALREHFKPEGYVMAEPECVEEARGAAPEYLVDTGGAPLRSTRPAVIKKPEVVPLPEHCVALGPIDVPDTKKPALRERFKPDGYVMAEPECVEEARGAAPEYLVDTGGAPLRSTRPAVIKKPERVPLPEHCVPLGPVGVPERRAPALRAAPIRKVAPQYACSPYLEKMSAPSKIPKRADPALRSRHAKKPYCAPAAVECCVPLAEPLAVPRARGAPLRPGTVLHPARPPAPCPAPCVPAGPWEAPPPGGRPLREEPAVKPPRPAAPGPCVPASPVRVPAGSYRPLREGPAAKPAASPPRADDCLPTGSLPRDRTPAIRPTYRCTSRGRCGVTPPARELKEYVLPTYQGYTGDQPRRAGALRQPSLRQRMQEECCPPVDPPPPKTAQIVYTGFGRGPALRSPPASRTGTAPSSPAAMCRPLTGVQPGPGRPNTAPQGGGVEPPRPEPRRAVNPVLFRSAPAPAWAPPPPMRGAVPTHPQATATTVFTGFSKPTGGVRPGLPARGSAYVPEDRRGHIGVVPPGGTGGGFSMPSPKGFGLNSFR